MNGTSDSAPHAPRSRLQFTVRGLLLAVTACAGLLSLWLYLGGLAETVMCASPLALGAVAYWASRRPRAGGTEATPTVGTAPQRTPGFVGRCLPYFFALLFAPVGFLLAFHLCAVLELYLPGGVALPSVTLWAVWHLSGTAVGAGVGAILALFVGSRLGRGFTPLIGMAVGGSVSMLVALPVLHGLLPEPDIDDEVSFLIPLLWSSWFFGLIAGVIVAWPLRGYAEHAGRWAARATAAVVCGGLVVVALGMGWRFLNVHGLIVTELASAMGSVCLVAIVAGASGAVLGAFKDRKSLAVRTQRAVDGAASGPASPSSTRRFWIGRAVGWLLLAFLWVVPLVVALVLISRYEFSNDYRRMVSRPEDVGVIGASVAYRDWLRQRAIRRQTVGLPPVGRAEVMALADDHGSADQEPFPLLPGRSERFDYGVHSRANVSGDQAEALAQIWRTRSFGEGSGGGWDRYYMLRFFSRGRLAMEAMLTWENESASSVIVAERRLFSQALTDQNEELLDRLQEIAPLPDATKVEIAYNHGSAAFEDGQYERALQEFNRAVQLDPKRTELRLSRAELYLATGKYDKAIEEYTGLVRRYPKYPDSLRLRARAYIASGDLQRAVEDYTRALRHCEQEGEPLSGILDLVARGLTYEQLGDFQQAVDDFTRAIQLDTDPRFGFSSCGLLDARARVYAKLGDLPRALADLDAYFELHERLRNELGWSAEQYVNPWLAQRYVRRARIREALGDHEGARVDLYLVEQAGLDPDSDEWYIAGDPPWGMEPGIFVPDSGAAFPRGDPDLPP